MPLEFRVTWRREGRKRSTRVYQTWEAAVRKVRGIKALEAIKDGTAMADMPDLVDQPVLEVRQVGEWQRHDYQPEASEYDRQSMEGWAGMRWPSTSRIPVEPADSDVPF